MTISALIQGRNDNIVHAVGTDTVTEAARKLAEMRIGALPVLNGKKVVGIFSERDVIYGLRDHGEGMLSKTVAEVMTTPVITVSPDSSVMAALSEMTRRRIRHFPVVENDELVGFISIGDLVKYRIDKIESEADAMRQYIQGS